MVRRLRSLPLAARYAALPVRISPNHAGINRESFTADQPFGDAALYGRLEHLAQQIAVAETTVPVLRKSRMVRHRSVEPQPAKPSITEVQMDIIAQPPLRADAEAVPDDQHADHQLRVDRRSAHLAVERAQVLADTRQIHKPVDRP